MSNITVNEAQSWTEKTKLNLGTALDSELEASVSSQVLARVAQVYDTSSWASPTTTPKLVRSVIAMLYVAWWYDRTYSEDAAETNSYAALLRKRADVLLEGIVSGSITLTDVAVDSTPPGEGTVYPNDLSTASYPTPDDTSLGSEKFTMGVIW